MKTIALLALLLLPAMANAIIDVQPWEPDPEIRINENGELELYHPPPPPRPGIIL